VVQGDELVVIENNHPSRVVLVHQEFGHVSARLIDDLKCFTSREVFKCYEAFGSFEFN
jgi:hypothetical protein